MFPAALMAAEGRSNDMDIEPDGIEVSDSVTVLWKSAKTTLYNFSSEPFNFSRTFLFFRTLFNLSPARK